MNKTRAANAPKIFSVDENDVLTMAVLQKARELGFDLSAVAPAEPSRFASYWEQWICDGKAGEMQYLANRIDERLAPEVYLPGAVSAICVAVNYHVPLAEQAKVEGEVPGRIARYALGDDYHKWMKDRIHDLADWLRATAPGTKTKCGVDTAPIPERELAARAGIGWVGKNTCVINERIGSWLFLGTILTTAHLKYGTPATDRCGTCRRCLDACPTGALSPEAPYQLDPRKCISYLTIEHRSEIAPELEEKMGNWLYGCDICQDVCPWNRRAPAATDPRLQPRVPTGHVDAAAAVNWTEEQWLPFSRRSAIRRVRLPQFQRNARIVLKNAADPRAEQQEAAQQVPSAPESPASH